MAHIGQKLTFRLVGRIRRLFGCVQLFHQIIQLFFTVGQITHIYKHLHHAAIFQAFTGDLKMRPICHAWQQIYRRSSQRLALRHAAFQKFLLINTFIQRKNALINKLSSFVNKRLSWFERHAEAIKKLIHPDQMILGIPDHDPS